MTDSSNAFLGDTLFYVILFFTASAISFLINLKYTYFYNYTKAAALLDCATIIIFTYLFSPYLLLLLALGLLTL